MLAYFRACGCRSGILALGAAELECGCRVAEPPIYVGPARHREGSRVPPLGGCYTEAKPLGRWVSVPSAPTRACLSSAGMQLLHACSVSFVMKLRLVAFSNFLNVSGIDFKARGMKHVVDV